MLAHHCVIPQIEEPPRRRIDEPDDMIAADDENRIHVVFNDFPKTLLAFAQGVIRRFAEGNIFFNRHEIRHVPGRVMHRRNNRVFPIQRAVFAFIAELSAPTAARQNRRPQFSIQRVGLPAGFQDARRLADHFVVRVAGHFGIAGVHVFDPALQIGQHHPVRALLDRLRELQEFHALQIRDSLSVAGN